MKYKVKYNRNEYRQEYLKSEDWKNLKNLVMSCQPICQCCSNKATDVHHMVYRNIVDVKISDLLPVCRKCHDIIHQAINDGWISQNVKDLEEIKTKTLSINSDEKYKIYKKWMQEKHFLSEKEIKLLKTLQGFVMQKISGLVKRNVWYDKISEMKFTGKQILKIRAIIETALYRRKEKIDKNKKTILKPKKYSKDRDRIY